MSDKKRPTVNCITIPAGDVFFGAVLVCAVRYSLGRRTYMPALVTDWIMHHCGGMLAEGTISVMIRDVEEADGCDMLGDRCDAETWHRFREWLTEERV